MDLSNPTSDYENVLGFTNQTAVLLSGMGAKDILPKFKQRNISTEMLADLTIDDLQLLGADEELANYMRKQLTAISKRNSKTILTSEQRLEELLRALVNSNKQLSFIRTFLTYARLRIDKEPIDSFIEKNNTLRGSKALEIAAEATIREIQDARLAVEELNLLLKDGTGSTNFGIYVTILGGVALVTFLILKR